MANNPTKITIHNGKQEELTPHNREQVTMITCSPNMKNIVTWSDVDKSAVLNLIKILVTRNYLTVSDDKFVSMPIERARLNINVVSKTEEKDEMKVISKIEKKFVKRIEVGIFNFETGKNVSLKLPHSEMLVETLAFLNEDKLTMIMESYDEKIFLSNGRIFIYDENLGSITKWDINTLKFEAFFLFDNSFGVDNMKLDDNGVLLFVYDKYHDKTVIIDAVYLFASDIGARLLVVHHNIIDEEKYQYHICDPFAPYIPGESFVKANDLFKGFETNGDDIFENKYIIKYDKIVGFNNDGTLIIKELIPVNWIFYLRDTLKDSNSIFISSVSENIVDLIFKSKEIADKAITDIDKKMSKEATKVIESEKTIEEATTDIDKSKETTEKTTTDVYKEYQKKYFVTWTLKYENMKIFLTAEFKNDKIEQAKTKSDSIQIVPELYIIMVTYWGVLVWTFNTNDNKIELNYCWEDEGDTWDWDRVKVINLFYEIDDENFDEKNFDIKKLKKKSYFLPPSSYISMIRYNPVFSQSESPKDDRFLFNELIKKHINNKFFLIHYGKNLIEDIIKEDEDTLLRKLFNECIEQIEKDEEILNTQIFKIFSQSITEISKKNPSFFEDFVIKISLLCVLNVKKEDQTLKHLNNYQSYVKKTNLKKFYSLKIYISELRKFISNINPSDWKESTKPIITKITKLIKDEKQESEADKIQKIYESQENFQKILEKIMKKT
ncbi:31157_t:CDS:2 [Gigaspora margarita]|uniref:31157_t:CDS:1 n=1 Tax=Gigaspora margarita TaxID=4874 RepID=A0ABN7UI57_GIGMA|nr:31157_t:CDS:2 [Gigaspora margarita]